MATVDSVSGRAGWIRWRGLLLIFVAASFWPLTVMGVNLVGIIRPERILSVLAVVWTVGLVLIAVLTALGVGLEAAENTSFVAIVIVMSGGPILREFGVLSYLILTLAALAGWLFVRLSGSAVVAGLVWGTAVALAFGPVTALFESLQAQGSSVFLEPERSHIEMSTKPDIFLLVFDGYPGVIAADLDGLDEGVVDVVADLRRRGFQIPESSWASYWITLLSIPSLLDMGYPVQSTEWTQKDTLRDIQHTISGDNALIQTVQANGYQTHMVESGWSGASCGGEIDSCVPSPWLDEATYLTLRHTLAWTTINGSPGPYTAGTLAAFDWLARNGPHLSESSEPDLVFAHIMAPHPPFFLTPECSIKVVRDRGGVFFDIPDAPADLRERYLVEQMDCMDRFMLTFADLVDADDVIIFVSDHGTDRRHQTRPGSTDWDREAIVERLNNFLAVRLPDDCSVGDRIVIPNILRMVMKCLSTSSIETLQERMWINPMQEVESAVVEGLIAATPLPG